MDEEDVNYGDKGRRPKKREDFLGIFPKGGGGGPSQIPKLL